MGWGRALVAAAAMAALAGCSGGTKSRVAQTPTAAPSPTVSATVAAPSAPASPSASVAVVTPTATAKRAVAASYIFPVQGCRVTYGRYHHDYPATDIFTGKGCAFVAVTSGRVDEVSTVDRWSPSDDSGALRGGRSVSIVGDDGVRYYGSHLLAVAAGIAPGVRVRAGQLLGRIDNSGDARYTDTHVHFGISWPTRGGLWWIRRGEVSPYPYLQAWQAGRPLSPAAEVARTRAQLGQEPPCQAEC